MRLWAATLQEFYLSEVHNVCTHSDPLVLINWDEI